MAADSKGYYASLGLNPGASIEVVRAVYRQLAKECHPDTPNCRDGGARFRQITEAYDVLSNAAFKASYDQGTPQPNRDPPRQATQINPVLCQVCGKVTAQPRRLAFWRVTSFILVSKKAPVQKIYCSDCASAEQWKSTLWTSLLGWWGIPWGPAWAIMHGVKNATGGSREAEVDEALMWQNAIAFATRGEGALAVGLSNILRKSNNAEIGQKSAEIIRFFADRGIDPGTTLKDVWDRSFLRVAVLLGIAFAVPTAVAALILIPTSNNTRWRAAPEASSADPVAATSGLTQPPRVVPAAIREQVVPPEPVCSSPPANGEVLVDHRLGEADGHHLNIENGTTGDAIIKVREADGTTLASFFVARGATATLKRIPDGSYKVQFESGDKLAKDCRNFVTDESLSANEFPGPETLETRYEEGFDGTTVIHSELTYTLYPVPGGTVRPNSIDLREFNKP